MKKEAKVYEMNECDWWADYSMEDAKKNYLKFTGMGLDDVKEDWEEGWPVELSEDDLDRIKYSPDPYEEPDAEKRTFREELDGRIKKDEVPGFFATTEF